MTRHPQLLRFIGLSIAAGLASLLGYEKLDRPIALFFARQLQAHPLLGKATANIPDLLPTLVVVATAALLLFYLFGRKEPLSRHRPFFLAGATALPVTFLLKEFFQFLFSRIGTRLWLQDCGFMGFNWFSPDTDFRGFPSGHMAVATALLTVVWGYYPRSRPAVAASLLLLAFALVATDYHFLSDVIAGAYTGLVPALAAGRLLPALPLPTSSSRH
jgi:membrane-associated phospholipid phosphatase